MLVLTRRIGEEIVISGGIRVKVVSLCGERVRLGIDAPRTTVVDRVEIHQRKKPIPEKKASDDQQSETTVLL